jgi:hypothetical protein
MNTTANIALAVVLTAQHAFATEAVLTGPYRPHPAEIFAKDPATAMKESVTRSDFNEHRKAIEDAAREIRELKKQRDDLEMYC